MDQRERNVYIISFSLLFVAVLALWLTPSPVGPWDGVFSTYWTTWGALVISTIILLIGARRKITSTVPIVSFACLQGLIAVAVVLSWGFPFGLHDPWIHSNTIDKLALNPVTNSYPLFHALFATVATLIGLASLRTLILVPVISTTLGVLGTYVLARRLPWGPVAVHTIVLVAPPAFYFKFISRPFSLAMTLLVLVYVMVFVVTTPTLSKELNRRYRVLGVLLLLPLAYLHPLVAILAIIILSSAVAIIWVKKLPEFGLRSSVTEVSYLFKLAMVAGVLIVFVFLTTRTGERVVGSAIISVLFPAVDASSGAAVSGGGLIEQALTSRRAFTEAVARFSHVLATSVVVGFGVLVDRSIKNDSLVPLVTTTVTAVIFLFAAFFISGGVGIYRFVLIAPLLLLPAMIRSFRRRRGVTELVTVLLAVVVLLTGVGTAVNSPLTGGLAYSATEPQVYGVQWVTESASSNQNVIGTHMTHWLIEGMYGREVSRQTSPTGRLGRGYTRVRETRYSWQATETQSSLFVVDRVERSRAEFDDPAEDMNRRRIATCSDKIYSNAGTNVYTQRRGVCRYG